MKTKTKTTKTSPEHTPYMYQHLRSYNSLSGNPQRLYIVFNAFCSILSVIDEGYSGLPTCCRAPGMLQLPDIRVERKEYHDWKRQYRAQEER